MVVVFAALEGFCGVVTEMSSFLPAGPERGAAASAELEIGKQPESMGCRGSGLSRLWVWSVSGPLCVVVVVMLVGLVAACSDEEPSVVESSAAGSLPEATVTTLASVSTLSTSAAPSTTTTAAAAGPTTVPGGGNQAAPRAIAPLRLDECRRVTVRDIRRRTPLPRGERN